MRDWARPHAGLLVLLVGVGAVLTPGIMWGLPAYGTWSGDSLAPVGALYAAYTRFSAVYQYPPFHYALLCLVDAPYVGYLYLVGDLAPPFRGFPYGLARPLESLTVLTLLARSVSIVMGVGTVYWMRRATLLLTGDATAAWIAAAAVPMNTWFVTFAHLGNVDVPSLFWMTAALAMYVRLDQEPAMRTALILGIVAACAHTTKEGLYSVMGGFALVLTYRWVRARRPWRMLAAGTGSFILTYIIINNVVFGWEGFWGRIQLRMKFGEDAGQYGQVSITKAFEAYVSYPPTLQGHTELVQEFLGILVSGLGWGGAALAAAGVIIALRRRSSMAALLLVPAATYYIGSISLIRYVFERFTLPAALLLLPFAGVAGQWWLERTRIPRWVRLGALGIVIVGSVGWGLRETVQMRYDSRYSAEEFMSAHLAPAARVEVYAGWRYLPRVREMGYMVHAWTRDDYSAEAFSLPHLRKRNPDAIVLTSSNYKHVPPTVADYFDNLRTGRAGYTPHRFDGGPAWDPPSRPNRRISPTIYVLTRK